jgi:LmbE family N-acetylglucosaminyl deacetylase
MLVAPHPDDESLACSIILQRAVNAGAAICVVYATDGENNPWPQRLCQRRWRLNDSDRFRWGQLRRREALNALSQLGVTESAAQFLHLPDQGLTDLLLFDCDRAVAMLTRCIVDWEPTDVLLPALSDTHPDHSALSVLVRLAMQEAPSTPPFAGWDFMVHGYDAEFSRGAAQLRPTPDETIAKRAAIHCHRTQLRFSRGRFMAYASRPERLMNISSSITDLSVEPNSQFGSRSHDLTLDAPLGRSRFMSGATRLLIAGCDISERRIFAFASMRQSASRLELVDCRDDKLVAALQCQRSFGNGLKIAIPPGVFSSDYPLYIKLERRRIFFDQAGWIEVAAQPIVSPEWDAGSPAEASLAFD